MLNPKLQAKIGHLPDSPGVYFFMSRRKEILYIGKATSLRSRVKSYFAKDIGEKRSPLIGSMVMGAVSVDYKKTDSVLEALILEAALIQKHLPPYNTAGKDQKSWNYVVFTKEDFPQVLIIRERDLETSEFEVESKFGPFTNSYELREALKIIRRIFPYRDSKCVPLSGKGCFNYQIGLCPGVCVGKVTPQEYRKTLRHIKMFFEGKKESLIRSLKKQMREFAREKNFEKAQEIKRKIGALQHIQDIAMIKESYNLEDFRIEAYDISHISGTSIVGVMTVVEGGAVNKNEYRKFKIRGQRGADDTRALKEVLERRFGHPEWRTPNLLVIDGGVAQVNAALGAMESLKFHIPVVGVVKDERHKPKGLLLGTPALKPLADKYRKEILLANSESHRFAIKYHRNLRSIF